MYYNYIEAQVNLFFKTLFHPHFLKWNIILTSVRGVNNYLKHRGINMKKANTSQIQIYDCST